VNLLAIHFIQPRKRIDAPGSLQFPNRLLVNPLSTLLRSVPVLSNFLEREAPCPELDDLILPTSELCLFQDVSELSVLEWIAVILVKNARMDKGLTSAVSNSSLKTGIAEERAFFVGRDCQVAAGLRFWFVVIVHCRVPNW